MSGRVIWRSSAFRHGYTEEQLLWAIAHNFTVVPMQDRRYPGKEASMYLTPPPPGLSERLEVGVLIDGGVVDVFHAMAMRSKWQPYLDALWEEQ